MRQTKTLTFQTGPLRLVYECSGSIVHAVVIGAGEEEPEDLLHQAAYRTCGPEITPLPTARLVSG